MGITVQPGTQAKTIEELRELQGGGKGTTSRVGEGASPLAEGADNLTESMEGGLTYRRGAGVNSATGTIDNQGSSAAVPPEGTRAKGVQLLGETRSYLGEHGDDSSAQDGASTSFDGAMKGYIDKFASSEGVINGKTSQLMQSGKIVEAQTAKQEAVAAWIENTMPAMEDMENQITALEQEALGTIPQELGISAETLDEAIEQLSEMIDADKMEELTQKQERAAEISQELETKDPEDPDYDALIAEQEGIQTELEDPDNAIMMQASSALATIADYTDAIAEIANAMTELQAEIDAKGAENDAVSDANDAETAKMNNLNQAVNSQNKVLEDTQKQEEEECDNFKVGYEITLMVGDGLNTLGGVSQTTGTILSMFTPTAALGGALETVGMYSSLAGGVTETAAHTAAAIHYDDASYAMMAVKSGVKTAVSFGTSFVAQHLKSAELAAKSAETGSKVTTLSTKAWSEMSKVEKWKKVGTIVDMAGNGLDNAATGVGGIIQHADNIKKEKAKG